MKKTFKNIKKTAKQLVNIALESDVSDLKDFRIDLLEFQANLKNLKKELKTKGLY
jgi:hypothetical protein